ncbi:P-loop containing nucleoside triphosphate hydrolase protein [Stachybotrys elegans]|uniref:P-loop containing nucleoside triphosphate hydrolase protein n=1 Tax=Stachybotrys elegans TaxID=80388 RepID=A0A8K0WNV0_9HYPO|nr:P-loop containing nucleoside triphosphate hydrolase protein [Stachybotrys elegans]
MSPRLHALRGSLHKSPHVSQNLGLLPKLACTKLRVSNGGQLSFRRMNGYKRTITSSDVLRCSPQPTAQTLASAADRQQLITGSKFFQHGYSFLYSAESLRHHANNVHVPEVIILGASNVGKSSFINALVSQSNAARVSHRPGKTTMMNAYGIGPPPSIDRSLLQKGQAPPKHSLILMDTPGYGYKSQASWGGFILEYLKERTMLRGAILLLSSEKKLLREDKWMLRTLAESNTRTMVILTKADKNRSQWSEKCDHLANDVRTEMQRLEARLGNGWARGSGWMPDIHVTAAHMSASSKLGNGAGMGGARLAILDMAGYSPKAEVEQKAETIAYTGQIVSFDDIVWKT